MNITFSEATFFVANMKIEYDYDYHTIIAELQNEDWRNWHYDSPNAHKTTAWDNRFGVKGIPKSPILNEIKKYTQSNEVKHRLLDILYSWSPHFEGLWGLSLQEMFDWTTLHAEFMLDKPGFYLEPHNDYRRLVCAGMLYFNEYDDVSVSTTFFNGRDESNGLILPNGLGNGWMAVNEYINWHSGKNESNYDRYSALVALTIKGPYEYNNK